MKRGWVAWTLLAMGLHLLPLALLRRIAPAALRQPVRVLSDTELEIETELESGALDGPGATTAMAAALAPRAASAKAVGARRFRPEPLLPGAATDPLEAEPAGKEPSAPRLSPEALGIGVNNPFLFSDLARRSPGPEAQPARPPPQRRLQRSLAEAILHAEQRRSLGPEGPVLSALVSTTRNSEAPANARALFRCVVTASGKLASVELLESDGDPAPWRRIARRVLAALAATTLRLPKTGQGATLAIRVSSRQTLPSGADPGLDVSVLGIPLQKGDGERSGKIEILNPLSPGNILNVQVDPVDVGAAAQRVVHAHLEKMSVD
jgi:hypothetical protein